MKEKVDITQQVGITESGEIAFNLEAFDNLRSDRKWYRRLFIAG